MSGFVGLTTGKLKCWTEMAHNLGSDRNLVVWGSVSPVFTCTWVLKCVKHQIEKRIESLNSPLIPKETGQWVKIFLLGKHLVQFLYVCSLLCGCSGSSLLSPVRQQAGPSLAAGRWPPVAECRLWCWSSVVECTGQVALWHVGLFPDQEWTPVPSTGWQILSHWTVRESLGGF